MEYDDDDDDDGRDFENELTEQDVFDICCRRVDERELIRYNNVTICVDGTSCTKKSSILERTGYPVMKTQRLANFQCTDTFFPSTIGYITTGILSLSEGDYHVNDRSPLNPLEWRILWRVMDDYVKRYGNIDPELLKDDELFFKDIVDLLDNLNEAYYYKMFRKKVNCIALIDSDTGRCDSLHYLRNESSDRDRVEWKFYSKFQNLLYKRLYKKSYIDLAWFNNTDDETIVKGISMFIRSAMGKLKMFNSEHGGPINRPLFSNKLPLPKFDYNLINMETHVYRSIGRVNCRLLIANQSDKEEEDDDDGYSSVKPLKEYVPSYLNVSKITVPFKNESSREFCKKLKGFDDRKMLIPIHNYLQITAEAEQYKPSLDDYDDDNDDNNENKNDEEKIASSSSSSSIGSCNSINENGGGDNAIVHDECGSSSSSSSSSSDDFKEFDSGINTLDNSPNNTFINIDDINVNFKKRLNDDDSVDNLSKKICI